MLCVSPCPCRCGDTPPLVSQYLYLEHPFCKGETEKLDEFLVEMMWKVPVIFHINKSFPYPGCPVAMVGSHGNWMIFHHF